MSTTLTGVVFLILTSFVISIVYSHSKEDYMEEFKPLQVGMAAPDITLMDENRVERNLSDYLGSKNVVLAFYPKDFTGG